MVTGKRNDYLDDADFRVYTHKNQLDGTVYFEFYAGDFENDVEYWNEGSIYIADEAMWPFNDLIRERLPDYQEIGSACFQGEQVEFFRDLIRDFSRTIAQAADIAEARKSLPFLALSPEGFLDRRVEIVQMLDMLADYADKTLREGGVLWELGL